MMRVLCGLKTGIACAVAAGLLCHITASGSVVIYAFDNTFSGTNPDGASPWVSASLSDVTPGTVQLSISNLNVSASEKVTELYLNITPSYSPNSLQFTFLNGSSGVTAPLPSLGEDSFKADGDGKYDILFQFSQTPSTSFGANEYLIYQITGVSTLTSSDFIYMSSPAGGHGPFYSAVHMQGISATGVNDTSSYSGWISPSQVSVLVVPEPSAWALFLLAGAFATGLRWRRGAR